MLPATLGTGIATSLGLSGATAGLVAAAAPKAIGAGIGTLLAGGDLGDAALNAVGFGAGGALLGGAAPATAAPATAATTAAPTAVNPATIAGAPVAAAAPAVDPMKLMQMGGQLMAGGSPPPVTQQAPIQRSAPTQMSNNPMLASAPSAIAQSPGAASMMSPAAGIAAIPAMNNQPMSSQVMTAGFGPNQQGAVNEYLRSQGTIGFV